MRVLLIFSQVYSAFRRPEMECVCSMLEVPLRLDNIDFEQAHLHVFEFAGVLEVFKILSRSMLIKSAYEIFATSSSHDGLLEMLEENKFIFERYDLPSQSWSFKFYSYGRKHDNEYKMTLMKKYCSLITLSEAPISLSSPTNEFVVIEENDGEGQRQLKLKYDIKKRKYIGNSTMDPELAFVQANLALCRQGLLAIDPFCGTGGIMLSVAHFGAQCLGVEINYNTARAKGKSSRSGELRLNDEQTIYANFMQYGLEDRFVGVLLADSSQARIWHRDEVFDAIVTDPPYGIREKGQKVGTKPNNYSDKPENNEVTTVMFPSKTSYTFSKIYLDLVDLATRLLRIEGRLCFWFPVIRKEYSENILPQHKCMRLLYNCEQILTKEASRRLLVYEKIRRPQFGVEKAFFTENCYESATFRDKVFNA